MEERTKLDGISKYRREWSNIEPQAAEPWLFRSEAAEGLKDWGGLVNYLDRIPRNDRRAVGALLRKSIVEFENLNRPWDGVKTCDDLLELEPRVLVAHKQTIFFFMMSLQRHEAVRRIRRAIRLRRESPETYIFLASSSWLLPGSLYRVNNEWLKSDPESEVFEVARAMQVYNSGGKEDPNQIPNFEHIPSAEQMLQKYPHNLELLAYFMNLGMANGNLEKVQQMLEAYPNESVSTSATYWRAQGWCEDTLGQLENAEESLRRAFSIDPYWWHIHFKLHDLLRRRGKLDEAAQFFKIYKVSKELNLEITSLNGSPESLDEKKFCRQLLVLAELIEDYEVIAALQERVTAH